MFKKIMHSKHRYNNELLRGFHGSFIKKIYRKTTDSPNFCIGSKRLNRFGY